MPNSLKNLVLTVNEERIDLNELKNLKNLEYLQLIYYSPEIQPIEISSQLQQFRIRTTLKKLTLSSWKLPDFVQVLDISGEIELIKDLYKFPSQLQDLILSHNNLRDLPTFPPTLKNLNLSTNKLGALTKLPVFPSSLEKLNIADDEISDETLATSDLSHCTKLKSLDFSNNSDVNHLLLECFPSSIKHLNVRDIPLQSISGSFEDLPNLELIELDSEVISVHVMGQIPRDKYKLPWD